MEHTLFATVNEMLDPEALSTLGAVPVKNVCCVPLHKDNAYSGSHYSRVETNDRLGPHYFLKRIPSANDARIGPYLNRSVTLWQHGLLDRLPSEIEHAIVACSHDGAGYAILMHDVSRALMPGDRPFTLADHTRFLDTMVALHAEFWEDHQLTRPDLGLWRPNYFLTSLPPERLTQWASLEQVVEPDVANVVRTLLSDPQPLYDALMDYPSTLVHNDLWWANLGILHEPRPKVVMLDWDLVTAVPPAVDLALYLGGDNVEMLPTSKDATIEYYRTGLVRCLGARSDETWWSPQLELALLGCFLRQGKWTVLGASSATDDKQRTRYMVELDWWSIHIRMADQWL